MIGMCVGPCLCHTDSKRSADYGGTTEEMLSSSGRFAHDIQPDNSVRLVQICRDVDACLPAEVRLQVSMPLPSLFNYLDHF